MTDAFHPRPLAAAVLATLLAACAVGPDYVRPTLDAPARFHHADPALTRAGETERAFWERMGDPVLAQLIEDALRDNRELHIALARLERARALLGEAGRDYLPTVRAGAHAGEQRASAFEAAGVSRADRDIDSRGAEASVSWELDLFGRVRRNVEAARGEREASEADLAALQVAVAGEVARNYYLLRGLQTRLAVAQDNARNQERSLELVRARADAGGGTELDSARARAQLELTLSRVPALTAEVQATQHRLAVLTGREPGALGERLDAPAPWPPLPELLAVGTPPDLLARRPDVAAAERRLAAATARVGVATADLYPRFSLDGLIGSLAGNSSELFERNSERRRVLLGIDWSFLDRGRVRDRIDAAGADARAAFAAWQQASLLALEEAETALVRYAQSEREREHLEEGARASARAAELARLRFEGGVAAFLDVLDAERARLEAEDLAAAARMRQAQALVGLHAALAGGWPERMPQPAPAPEPSSGVAATR